MKEIVKDISKEINVNTLTKLNYDKYFRRWFTNNIGRLPVENIDKIEGDYRGYINSLKEKFIYSKYDERGNRIYCKVPGYWVRWEYNDNNQKIYKEDSEGYWEKWKYDKQGRLISYKTNLCEERITYDKNWSFHEIIKPNNIYKEKRQYDEKNRLIYMARSDGYWERYSYNENYRFYENSNDVWAKWHFKDDKILLFENSEGLYKIFEYPNIENLYADAHTYKCKKWEIEKYDDKDNLILFENYMGIEEVREYINDGKFFIQKCNGEIEVKVPLN